MGRSRTSLKKYDCDRSGFTFRKDSLSRQKGLLVSKSELDDPDPIYPKDYPSNPRPDSNNIDPDDLLIFEIDTDGISSLAQSFNHSEDGEHQQFYMLVSGDGGPVSISANPQIAFTTHGTRLTLKGTSDTDTLTIVNGQGVRLISGYSMKLKNNCTLSLVFDDDLDLWIETSRDESGIF